MGELLCLSRADVERLLDIDEMLQALTAALIKYSAGSTSVPPRNVARAADRGLLGAMPGYVPGVGLEVKLVTVFPHNHERGMQSHQGLIALFDDEDGSPLALMDASYITAMRTGGSSAVAARALARQDAAVLAILGAGVQGQSHLATLPRIRSFAEIRVASRHRGTAEALARHRPGTRVCASFEEAVRGADVVACCTDAREPILKLEWIAAGAHVSSVGGTFGPEIGGDIVSGTTVFVEWRGAALNPPPTGASELQGMNPERLTEVGEVLAGTRPGRTSRDEITLYKSTGLAVEDAAAARLVYDAALKDGSGTHITI